MDDRPNRWHASLYLWNAKLGTLIALSKITEDGHLTSLMGLADQPYLNERYFGWVSDNTSEASLNSEEKIKK